MSWSSSRSVRPQDTPGHLQHLAEQMGDLSERVRQTIAEMVGASLSQVIRDTIRHFWQPALIVPPPLPHSDPYERREDWENDPWSHEMSEEDEPGRAPILTPSEGERAPSASMIFPALGLQVAGWWLQRRGSWQGALVLGLATGGLGMVGPRLMIASLNILQTLGNLYSLDQMLVAGGASLRKN